MVRFDPIWSHTVWEPVLKMLRQKLAWRDKNWLPIMGYKTRLCLRFRSHMSEKFLATLKTIRGQCFYHYFAIFAHCRRKIWRLSWKPGYDPFLLPLGGILITKSQFCLHFWGAGGECFITFGSRVNYFIKSPFLHIYVTGFEKISKSSFAQICRKNNKYFARVCKFFIVWKKKQF
jgi:hypothetical protein